MPNPDTFVCTSASPRLRTRCRVTWLLLGLFGLSVWAAPARAQVGDTLVIAAFNAEWLFDGVGDNARSPWQGQPDGARAQMQAVADVLRAIDADIVNLVEVKDLEVLERLNADFLDRMGYGTYLVDGRDTYTGQDVGLLLRIAPNAPLEDLRVTAWTSSTPHHAGGRLTHLDLLLPVNCDKTDQHGLKGSGGLPRAYPRLASFRGDRESWPRTQASP